jgi:type II secretory pathway component PulF
MVSSLELARLYRALASAIEREAPLDQELRVLAESVESRDLRGALLRTTQNLAEGRPLPEALSGAELPLPSEELAQLQAGVRAGRPAGVLAAMADRRVLSARVSRALRTAVVPVLCVWLLMVPLLVMAAWLGRIYGSIYTSLNIALPAVSRAFVALGDHAVLIMLVAPLLFVGAWPALRLSCRTWFVGAIELLVPVWGRLVLHADLSNYCASMAELLDGGVPLEEAAAQSCRTARNGWLREALERIAHRAADGMDPSVCFRTEPVLPRMMLWTIGAGHVRGDLPATFRALAELYSRGLDSSTAIWTSLVPILGFFVILNLLALVVVALLTPLVSLIQGLGGL